MMLRLLKIVIYCSITPAFAQVNMFDALEERYSLDLDRESFPQLTFDWNFEGKVQASVNAGLTELLDNKDYKKALVNFDEAIVKLPSCLPAFYYRGICYKILDNLPEAKEDLSKASVLAPDRPEVLLELGEVYELLDEYRSAEELYEKAIALGGANAAAYLNMANLCMRQNLSLRAGRYLKKSVESDPSYIKSYVRHGILFYNMSGKSVKSIEVLGKALAVDSTFQPALFWRGMMYLRGRDFENCLKDWNKLARQNPEDPTFILLRASLYLELEEYEKAFIDLKNIFSKSYSDENLFRGMQSSADRRLDLQFAVSYIARTIYGLDDEAGNYVKRGFCFMIVGRRADAIQEFKRSFDLQASALSLFLTAISHEHSDKHDSAFYYYNEALKFDDDIFDAHKKRAIYFSELKDWKSASRDFDAMIRLEPKMKVTYRLRAMIRIDFKDNYGAMLDLSKYLELDSTDHEIYVYRAYCEDAVKDFAGANRDYRRAMEINPDEAGLYDLVVTSDLALGDTTHALATIAVCEEKFGVLTLLFSKKIRIYINQNRLEQARSELDRVMGNKSWFSMQEAKAQSLIYFLEGWVDYLGNDEDRALRNLTTALSFNGQNLEAMYLRSKVYISKGERTKAVNDLKALAEAGYSDSQALLDQLR